MRVFVLIIAVALSSGACVFFNTFYNAQKYFRQAEKDRKAHEKVHAGWELEEGKGIDTYQIPRPQKADQLYDQAARKASRVLEKYKESDLVDDAMFLMGRSFYWRGEYLRAVQAFRDLEINFPASEFYNRARYWRALCLEDQRIYDQAQQLYRTLVDEADEEISAKAGWRLGEMAFAREDYIAAAQEYSTTLDAFSQADIRAGLWLRLGAAILALEDSTRYAEAGEAFEQALEENPDRDQEYRARLNIGKVLYLAGDADGALRVYERLLADGDFRAYEGRTRLLIGQYYQDRRQLERAVSEYEQVRDDFPLSPSSAMALYRTGLLYLQERGDTELAGEYFQETGSEKAGSQGARLAQEMMRHLSRLQNLQERVHYADSLAADSLAGIPGPVLLLEGWQRPEGSEGEVVVAHSIEVLDNLFTIAEVYRDLAEQPDSSIAYYGEILRRFPQSEQLPRAIYSISWIHMEMLDDRESARHYLDQLIEEFPASAHANEARLLLGHELRVTDDERAAVEFAQIEKLRLQAPEALETYVPLLDSLAIKYMGSPVGAKATYLSAVAYEDLRGDTLEAEQRYAYLEENFRETRYGELAVQRREARADGLVAKLERSLKAVGGVLKPGEYIEVLALEPDTLDTVAIARKYMGFALRAHRRGEIKTARVFYERSLEEQLNNAQGLYLLGNLSWDEGFFKEAIELYRQTLSFAPNHLHTHYRLFGAFLAEAEEDSANFYLRQLLKRDARNPQMRFISEQYPDLNEGEELEQDEMEELAIAAPEDEIRWAPRDLPLGDFPLVRHVVVPSFPVGALGDSIEVLVDVLIDKEGQAESVEVFRGEGPFAEAAVQAAYDYEFYPALRRDGKEIKVWVELGIPFFRRGSPADTTAALRSPPLDEGI
ncbi:MAG: tetratricopeptide (TPR) repeat protein [Candidatus Latescibacterota bacterium]|jgi:tetratricopeptide (TPR) repeat protein